MNELVCDECHESKPKDNVHRNRKTRLLICDACSAFERRNDKSKHKACGLCGVVAYVQTYDKDNKPVCEVCYHKNRCQTCCLCRQKRPVAVRVSEDLVICNTCYSSKINLNKCSVCKRKKRPVKIRLPNGDTVCPNCYEKGRRANKKVAP